MRSHFLLLVGAVPSLLAAQAADRLPLTVATTGDSGTAIVDARAIVREIMERTVAVRRADGSAVRVPNNVPGMSVAVMVRGRLVWTEGFGFADLERRVPATPRTRYRIGSLSKLLTVAALARLVDAGEMELDAPVQRYVPGFPAKRWPVTIRQLAGHTSGVRHYLGRDFPALGRQSYATLEEGLAIFAKDSLLFQPGFRYTYSSYGYNLLGVAIEAAAKARFAAGLQRLVLTPLAMWSTVPDYKDSVIIDRAAGYDYGRDQRVINAPYDDASYKWPSGGYLSTAEDVARLAASHLGESFLSAPIRNTLFTSQRLASGAETRVGLGWRIGRDSTGRAYYHHGGAIVGGRGFVLAYPAEEFVVVLLANIMAAFDEKDAARLAEVFARREPASRR